MQPYINNALDKDKKERSTLTDVSSSPEPELSNLTADKLFEINISRYIDECPFKIDGFPNLSSNSNCTCDYYDSLRHSTIKVPIIEQDPCMREIINSLQQILRQC